MRILKLEFENLNSLKGKWEIDFTSEDFKKNHDIFVICGATGSGKTTILDAISLGLYGKTPRLEQISQSNDEIMTYRTGFCFSRVTYQCKKGVFVSEVSHRRAGGRPDGKLQQPSFIIKDADGIVVDQGALSKLPAVTQNIIQLDYLQFCRSIMLAQGEFTAFLESKSEDKAKILEKLTGTEKFRAIGALAHEKFSKVKSAYDAQKGKINELQEKILTDEDRKALEKEKDSVTSKIKAAEDRLSSIQSELDFLEVLSRLSKAVETAKNEKAAAEKAKNDFSEEEERLKNAEAARSIEGCYVDFSNVRSLLKNNSEKLETVRAGLLEAEKKSSTCKKNREDAENLLSSLREDFEKQSELWKKVRELDGNIENSREKENAAKNALDENEGRISETRETIASLEKEIAGLREELSKTEEYLSKNQADSKLSEVIAALQVQEKTARSLVERKDELLQKKNNLASDKENLSQKLSARKTELSKLEEKVSDLLQKNLAAVSRLLYEQLQEGKPCPVCGVPFMKAGKKSSGILKDSCEGESVPSEISGEGVSSSEKKASSVGAIVPSCGETAASSEGKKLLSENSRLFSDSERLRNEIAALESKLSSVFEKYEENEKTIAKAEEDISSLTKDINCALEPWALKISLSSEAFKNASPFESILLQLEKRQSDWTTFSERRKNASSDVGIKAAKKESEEKNLSDLEEAFEASKKEFDKISGELEALKKERTDLFGDKNCEKEEAAFKDRISEREKACDSAREAETAASNEKSGLEAEKAQLEKNIAENKSQLEEKSLSFEKALKASPFSDEKEFLSSRLEEGVYKELSNKQKEISERFNDAKTALNIAEKNLEEFKKSSSAHSNENRTQEEVLEEKEKLQALKEELKSSQMGISSSLIVDSQYRDAYEKACEELEKLSDSYEKWSKMKSIVGKKEGDDVSIFVQALAFKKLLDCTNRHLFDITKRYRIVSKEDPKDPLAFEINDIHQDKRSVVNLSGGEKFIVSLSLALGISEFASRNVRVDSLFLDEGFGTLSGELLFQAINALKELQKKGKMLGIITHVQDVINEIDKKIEVKSGSDGYSRLIL